MTPLIQLIEIQPLPEFRIRLRFRDGTSGEVDLSRLAGRGVFSLWNERGAFERAVLRESRAVVWSEDVALSADSLYLQLTGKRPDEIFPKLRSVEPTHA